MARRVWHGARHAWGRAVLVPWLLLTTTPSGTVGTMSTVTSIQRLQTVGGVAPAGGCGVAADIGKEARVPYTAIYVYFVRG